MRRVIGVPVPFCTICDRRVPNDDAAQEVSLRSKKHTVCSRCRKRYHRPAEQLAAFGFHLRLVERSEVPVGHRKTDVYKILLLAKEQLEIRQKEVNWSVDEKTKLILKLPELVSRIVGKTFAVCGDGAKLSDDEALIRIRDLLEAIDPEIINRNKNKRLP